MSRQRWGQQRATTFSSHAWTCFLFSFVQHHRFRKLRHFWLIIIACLFSAERAGCPKKFSEGRCLRFLGQSWRIRPIIHHWARVFAQCTSFLISFYVYDFTSFLFCWFGLWLSKITFQVADVSAWRPRIYSPWPADYNKSPDLPVSISEGYSKLVSNRVVSMHKFVEWIRITYSGDSHSCDFTAATALRWCLLHRLMYHSN